MAGSGQDRGGERPVRIRDFGVSPGVFATGALNAITDVEGVLVGHATRIEGDSVRTGVTAVLPHGGNLFQEKVPAAVYVGNGFGKAAGLLQVQELGTLESPIVLTNTLGVGASLEGVVLWTLDQPGNEEVRSVNAVVGECNDGRLNDIRAMVLRPEDTVEAIERSGGGPVAEGNVGGGTGMVSFGFKSGIGTSSRVLPDELGGWTVGVLVQSNFGGILTVDGRRVGEALGRHAFRDALERDRRGREDSGAGDSGDGSCMIVIATDAPLDTRSLERVAKRAIMGLARTGSSMSNGSGDFVIAFSTAERVAHGRGERVERYSRVPSDRLSPVFQAVVEATEEAVYNALVAAETMTGHGGRTVEAIDPERLGELLE